MLAPPFFAAAVGASRAPLTTMLPPPARIDAPAHAPPPRRRRRGTDAPARTASSPSLSRNPLPMKPQLAAPDPSALAPRTLAGLVVRPVVRDDAAVLIELCNEHAEQLALERRPYGPPRSDALELMEVLFEPPFGAWAWIAEVDGLHVGYASATAGFSMLERAYCLQLDDPYLRAPWRDRGIEAELFRHALDAARRFGCLNLQCQSPLWSDAARGLEAPVRALRMDAMRYVVRMENETAEA
ncbi:acetyltransferase domain protein [Lysobacter antibioticus]|uniref:Acetyltransferase domain protein n=2 Tax=Lysobacter antibioticus TaxID=84531 RepID=A0A0S2F3U0_LYSAN|nr:acetyltransferase domain protein [Lysobacter antibioticus]